MFNAQHNLLQIYGTLASENEPEIWTMNLRLAEGSYIMDGATVDESFVDSVLDDVEADLITWWTAFTSRAATTTKMVGFKFNGIDQEGHYINQEETFQRDFSTNLVGTGSSALPSQCTVAVTLHTDAARGLASKGRVYLPGLSTAVVGPDGRLTDSHRDSLANSFATLCTNLSNWPQIDPVRDPGRVVVMSKVGAGARRRVNGVTVGDRIDIQRRRANKYREHRSPFIAVNS